MKKCYKCNKEKSFDQFSKKGKSLQDMCKQCSSEYKKQYYLNNKNFFINKSNERKNSLKLWVAKYKETITCIICKESAPCCLDFHHTNPNINKCIVLCSNCHRKVHDGLITLI